MNFEDNPDYAIPAKKSVVELHMQLISCLQKNDTASIADLLAGDCRMQGERGFGKQGLQTKDKVVKKISEIAGKVKGSIVNEGGAIDVMNSGEETRFIVNVKKGFVSVAFGTLVVWKGNLASFVVFQKSPPDDFMIDNTERKTESETLDNNDNENDDKDSDSVRVAHFGKSQGERARPPFSLNRERSEQLIEASSSLRSSWFSIQLTVSTPLSVQLCFHLSWSASLPFSLRLNYKSISFPPQI